MEWHLFVSVCLKNVLRTVLTTIRFKEKLVTVTVHIDLIGLFASLKASASKKPALSFSLCIHI